jgi:hypothetical protein
MNDLCLRYNHKNDSEDIRTKTKSREIVVYLTKLFCHEDNWHKNHRFNETFYRVEIEFQIDEEKNSQIYFKRARIRQWNIFADEENRNHHSNIQRLKSENQVFSQKEEIESIENNSKLYLTEWLHSQNTVFSSSHRRNDRHINEVEIQNLFFHWCKLRILSCDHEERRRIQDRFRIVTWSMSLSKNENEIDWIVAHIRSVHEFSL